jgi:hypothetical protein
MGVRSLGENVEVDVKPDASGGSLVRVVSNARMVTTFVDWGKNRHNVNVILDRLIDEHGGHISEAEPAAGRDQ